MGRGIKISWVGGSIYPWYFDLTTHGISVPEIDGHPVAKCD
jgi:hypothetical protein